MFAGDPRRRSPVRARLASGFRSRSRGGQAVRDTGRSAAVIARPSENHAIRSGSRWNAMGLAADGRRTVVCATRAEATQSHQAKDDVRVGGCGEGAGDGGQFGVERGARVERSRSRAARRRTRRRRTRGPRARRLRARVRREFGSRLLRCPPSIRQPRSTVEVRSSETDERGRGRRRMACAVSLRRVQDVGALPGARQRQALAS